MRRLHLEQTCINRALHPFLSGFFFFLGTVNSSIFYVLYAALLIPHLPILRTHLRYYHFKTYGSQNFLTTCPGRKVRPRLSSRPGIFATVPTPSMPMALADTKQQNHQQSPSTQPPRMDAPPPYDASTSPGTSAPSTTPLDSSASARPPNTRRKCSQRKPRHEKARGCMSIHSSGGCCNIHSDDGCKLSPLSPKPSFNGCPEGLRGRVSR